MFANRLVASIFNNSTRTVIGHDFHLSGHYNSAQRFDDEVFAELWDLVKADTVRMKIVRVIDGGESAWAAVETRVTAATKYGELHVGDGCRAGFLLEMRSFLISAPWAR